MGLRCFRATSNPPRVVFFERRARIGRLIEQADLCGSSLQVAGSGVAVAGRPRLPMRLMASLPYLKHAYKLSDEELFERWAENVVWQHAA